MSDTFPTWCPQCGPHAWVDEDGCCRSCGADAMGDGADEALAALKAVGDLRAKYHAALTEYHELHLAYLDAAEPDGGEYGNDHDPINSPRLDMLREYRIHIEGADR